MRRPKNWRISGMTSGMTRPNMDLFALISLDLLDQFSQPLRHMKGHYVQMIDL